MTAASPSSATGSPNTGRPTGLARGAGGSPPVRAPTASSSSPRLSSSTGSRIWSRRRGSIGTGITGEFPFACPGCGGDIRLIAFINDPGAIRKILTLLLLHTEWRTARASARFSCPWPAERLGRARPGPRRPGNLSGVARLFCPTSTSTASDGIPCHGADGPREERFQGRSTPTRKIRP